MASILRKQNEMINVNPVTADQIPYGSGSVEDALDAITVYKDLTNLPANGEITSLVSTELANGYSPAYASVIDAQQLTSISGTPMISSLGGNRFFALFLLFSAGSSPTVGQIDSTAVIRVFFTQTT